MVILAGILVGALWGSVHVRRIGGSGKDMAQYAAVWGIIGAILGAVLTVILDRML